MDNIYVTNKQTNNMKEQIRTLQDWSLIHFNMIPTTIKQLQMIEKEYQSYICKLNYNCEQSSVG